MFAAAPSAQAAQYWTGNNDANFSNSKNWSDTSGRRYFNKDKLTGNKRDMIYLSKSTNETSNTGLCFYNVPASGYWRFHGQNKYTFDNSGNKGTDYDQDLICIGYSGADSKVRIYAITLKTRHLTVGGDASAGGGVVKYDMTGHLILDDQNNDANGYLGPVNITTTKTCDFFKGDLYATNANITCQGNMTLYGFVAEKTGGDWTLSGDFIVGAKSGASATFTQKSGTMTVPGGKWTKSAGGAGTINLDGGTFTTYHIKDDSGSLAVNFNGGTLKAHSSGVRQGELMAHGGGTGLSVNVGENGGTIDTSGHDFSVGVAVNAVSGTAGAFTVTGGGSVTFPAQGNLAGALTVGDNTALHWFDQDGAVSATCGFTSLALGAGSTLHIDGDATGVDALPATVTTTATAESKATIEIAFSEVPAPGKSFTLFSAESADAFYVKPMFDGSELARETAIENGNLVLTITAKGDYVWNETQTNWGDAGAWTRGGASATWADGNNAVFNTANAAAVLAADASLAELRFTADAEVSGSAMLTVPSVSVASGATGTIGAPTAGPLEKTGEGTLVLGSSRTDETTLSEGTLETGAGVVLAIPDRWRVGSVEGVTATVRKKGGDWTTTGNMHIGCAESATAAFYNEGGNLAINGNMDIGQVSGVTSSLLEISGGMVTNAAQYIHLGANSPATMNVRTGGKYGVEHSNYGLIVGGGAAGTLNVAGGDVFVGGPLSLSYNGGDATVTVSDGGVLTFNEVKHNTKTSGGTTKISFNGGTIRANADNKTLIPAKDNMTVVVKSGGGVIDTNGKTIAIDEPLLGDAESTGGGMTFTGGGSVTLASGNTYTGETKVELGTTVHIPSADALAGKVNVSIPTATPEAGVYTSVVIDGEGTLPGSLLEGVVAPEGAVLRLSSDGKTILCIYGNPENTWIGGASGSLSDATKWSRGTVPSGESCIIGNAVAATLTVGDTFAPSSITFPANSAAVTINSAAGAENAIEDVTEIVSLSTAVSHTINVPVYFAGDIQVKQAAMAEKDDLAKAHITFAGGAYAAEGCAIENADSAAVYSRCMFGKYYLAPSANSPWTATVQSGSKRICLADDSTLYIPHAGNLKELYIGNGAKVDVGSMEIDAANNRISYKNYGEAVVTNLTVSGTGDKYMSYKQGTSDRPGVFKFESVMNSMTGNWCYFADENVASRHVFYIGAGGLNFASSEAAGSYCFGSSAANDAQTIRPWRSDFTIGDRGDGAACVVLRRDVTFCTDDESGKGRTITIDAITRGYGDSPTVTVSGAGKLKVNKAAKNTNQPTVTVTDTATLAYAPGASLGTGKTTVGTGATLEVAQSGTVALGGDLTFADGATLKFTFTERGKPPVLDLTGKTVSFGSSKSINVSVDGVLPGTGAVQGKYVLTSGGNFSDATIALSAGSAEWAKSVEIEDGNIVLTVRRALCVIIR